MVLDRERVVLDKYRAISGEYIFVGKGTLENNAVGDLRIRFQTVPSGRTATLFGQVEGGQIAPPGAGPALPGLLQRAGRCVGRDER